MNLLIMDVIDFPIYKFSYKTYEGNEEWFHGGKTPIQCNWVYTSIHEAYCNVCYRRSVRFLTLN